MQIFCTTFCILLYVPPITTCCKFIFFHFKLWLIYKESSIMHTQNIWLLGITSTWAHNLFVLWAFGFPTVGGSILGKPKYTSISSRLSLFLTESLLCSFWVFTLFLVLFLELTTPHSSLSSLIYSLKLVEGLWLIYVISGFGGPIPLSLSGCLGGSGRSGIGTASYLQSTTGQWGGGTPSSRCPIRDMVDRARSR